MTPGISLFFRAISDLTLFAMHKQIIRQAPLASNILCSQFFTVRKRALAGDFSFVKLHQAFFEFLIVITMRNINGADAAIKATG